MADIKAKNQSGDNASIGGQRHVPTYLVPTPNGDDGADAMKFWPVIMGHKFIVLWTVIICTVTATIVAFELTPIYRAEVLLAPVTEEKDRGDLRALTGQLTSLVSLPGLTKTGSKSKDEAIATLKSRAFTLQFIQDENLLPALFDEYWDAGNSKWKAYSGKSRPTFGDAYELFDEKVRQVAESRKTGMVTVAVEWKDRELAAHWANTLVNRINSHMRRRVIEEAEKSVAYLNQELSKTSVVELQKAIYALIEEQITRIMMAKVRDEYSFKVIDPAVLPDADEFEKPQRGMIIGLGVLWGLLLGVCLAFILQTYNISHTSKSASNYS